MVGSGAKLDEMRDPTIGHEAPAAWPSDPIDLLVELYPRLLAAARPLSANERSAEDLVQEALVRTLVSHPDLTSLAYPLGYTRTVLWRLAYSQRRLRWTEVPLDTAELTEAEGVEADDHAAIKGGLAQLGHKQRACVALRYLYGLDDAAIARVLGCRPSTVRSQTARGLETLRALMKESDDEG
jgi:RNA polymerase sigma factor (sigma-70 family)